MINYKLWRISLNILFIRRSVLLWREKDNKSFVVQVEEIHQNLVESKMRQIS